MPCGIIGVVIVEECLGVDTRREAVGIIMFDALTRTRKSLVREKFGIS